MKALLTLAAVVFMGGASTLSADCCEPVRVCCEPVRVCCPKPCPPPCPRPCPCPVYTCAGSAEYNEYWKNQTTYKGAPNSNMNQPVNDKAPVKE